VKVYLAGPMSNIPNFNYPLFDEAATKLRAQGHFVFSPADNDRYVLGLDASSELAKMTGKEQYEFRRIALAHDLEWICRYAQAVALLPEWKNSTGATAEYYTAKALNLKIILIKRTVQWNGEVIYAFEEK